MDVLLTWLLDSEDAVIGLLEETEVPAEDVDEDPDVDSVDGNGYVGYETPGMLEVL